MEANELLYELRRDPYIAAMKNKIRRERFDTRITSPVDVLGERNLLALMLADLDFQYDLDPMEGFTPERVRTTLAQVLYKRAIPFWLTDDVATIINELPLPKHIIGKMPLPAPIMYVSYESGRTASNKPGRIQDGLMATQRDEGIELIVFGATDNIPTALRQDITFGARYPQDIFPESVAAMFLRFIAFINSPYTVLERIRASRPERRELMKMGVSHEPEVHVVVLRAKIHQPAEQASLTGSAHWQHRWWVRGHFRAQWYPSQKAHQVIWVGPYVKGPDGKPFKSSVYAVTR